MEIEIEKIEPKKRNWKSFILSVAFLSLGFLVIFFGARAYNITRQIVVSKSTSASPLLSGGGGLDFFGESLEYGDRRVNILLLGMGGENHPGGNLTDTILVASVDVKNKEVSMLSIPRDLYLNIDGFGYNKINSVLSLGKNEYGDGYKKYELIKMAVSDFLGVPIHYFALVNFDGFKEIIDIIGGVDVYVEENFYDPYFPDADVEGYEEFFVSAGWNHMDGTDALKYSRSRETTSDFDRSRRQQEIIMAVKDKLLEKESYTSAKKISQIIGVLQENLKTDLQVSEIQELIILTKDIDSGNIHKKVLDDGPAALLYADNIDGMYVLAPEDESLKQVHNFVKEYFRDPLIVSESPSARVIDGSNYWNAGLDLEERLNLMGFSIVNSEDGGAGKEYNKTFIYDYTGGQKKYVSEFLNDYLGGVDIIVLNEKDREVDFEIVLGADYTAN